MRSRSSSVDQGMPQVRSRSNSVETNTSPSGTLMYPKRSPRVGALATRSRSNSTEIAPATRSRSNSSSSESSPMQVAQQLTIYQVLASPCLKEALKWHSVSVFSFENIFFVEKVDCAWKYLFADPAKRDVKLIEQTAHELIKTFVGNDAPWEISLPANQRKKLAESVALCRPEDMKLELFDSAYITVVRDISRSLTQFQSTALFTSYMANREALDALFSSSKKGGTVSEVLARIRHSYRTNHPVKLELMAVRTERATHQCIVEGEVRGYACQETFTFRFFDLAGQQLLVVPANIFDSPSAQGRARSVTAPHIDRGVVPKLEAKDTRKASVAVAEKKKFSFSFGKSRAASTADKAGAAAPEAAAPVTAGLLRDLGSGVVYGPFAVADLRLWWKFHLLPPSTPVCWETSAAERQMWKTLGDSGELGFTETLRVQMVDPTRVTSFD